MSDMGEELYPDILRYRNQTIAKKLIQPKKIKLSECVNIYNDMAL